MNDTTLVDAPVFPIGVGIDTARYGHHVSFLREDRQPAATPLPIAEAREGYEQLRQQLDRLHARHPGAHFNVRVDAAGQYATNLVRHLRGLPLPITLSVGEPKRNKDYCRVHFPKRKADAVESLAMARVFPEENSSGVDRQGNPRRRGRGSMSKKGSDLVRRYLWTAARSAMQHNPAVRALYKRLRARGTRGDVAMGHCMRKLLHLVFAVWKTDRPFDKNHYPWEQADEQASSQEPPAAEENAAKEKAAGHKGDVVPLRKVVTAADPNVDDQPADVNPATGAEKPADRPSPGESVDYGYLRGQFTIEQVLRHVGHWDRLRGSGPQRRGPCPVHGSERDGSRSFSVNSSKNMFQCFNSNCNASGNALDLWAALHAQTIHQAALDLAATFDLSINPNREEEPVIPNAGVQ